MHWEKLGEEAIAKIEAQGIGNADLRWIIIAANYMAGKASTQPSYKALFLPLAVGACAGAVIIGVLGLFP